MKGLLSVCSMRTTGLVPTDMLSGLVGRMLLRQSSQRISKESRHTWWSETSLDQGFSTVFLAFPLASSFLTENLPPVFCLLTSAVEKNKVL